MMGAPCGKSRFALTRTPGLTLVESVISIVIVSVMLVAALETLGSVSRSRRTQASMGQGVSLAHQLMAEILQTSYEEPVDGDQTMDDGDGGTTVNSASDPPDPPEFGPESPETGGSRADWDDVDDYDGWSSTPPQMKDGTVLDDYAGWTRQVNVAFINPNNMEVIVGNDKGIKRVQVTITSPNGEVTTLWALRSEVGAYEHRPEVETTSITGVTVELQIGESARPLRLGANGLNQLSIDGGP